MKEEINQFTPEMIDKIARIWTHANISLLDVRYDGIYPDQPLQHYRMPSSMVIYTYGGAANVHLNHISYNVERFGMFHGAKGSLLSIFPHADQVHAFMVLYKAESLSFYRKELLRLQEQVNPFIQQFGCVPSNPVWHVDLFQRMFDSWHHRGALGGLQAKHLFYQSIHEMYRDLGEKGAQFLQLDPVSSAKSYLDENYMNPLLFQEIAHMFGISGGQLTRVFKKREGISLQKYLSSKRLEAARYHLVHTNGTVKEIAIRSGLVDELNLIRMFKRHYKMTPSEFRKKAIVHMHSLDIDNDYQRLYNENRLASLVTKQWDGEFTMYGKKRSREMIVAATMSLMLLLSACTSGTPANSGVAGNQSTTPIQQSEAKDVETTAQTRTIQTEMGEIEIPVAPQRIIAPFIQGDLLALGIKPVGTSFNDDAVFEEEIGDTSIGIPWELDLEQVMQLEPDLIIYSVPDAYHKLSQIAPTITVQNLYANPDLNRIVKIGDFVGRKEKAEQLYNELLALIAEIKQDLVNHEFTDKSVVLMEQTNQGGISIFGNNYGRGGELLYNHLGMKAPQRVLDDIINHPDDPKYREISLEVLHEYQGEFIFTGSRTAEALSGNPLWENLEAVKAGRVIIVDEGMFWFNDYLSLNAQLKYIQKELLAHAEK